jgi:hypothetical protein
MFDCSRVPRATCSIQIFGEREDVIAAALAHVVSVHGFPESSQLEHNVITAVDSYREFAAHPELTRYAAWA